jgi:1-deoxy-D-xylulose-5-phosphate reductoisomerase
MKNVIILGATGSIGTQTLDIIRTNQDRFKVVGISANTNVDALNEIAREFNVPDENVVLGAQNAVALIKKIAVKYGTAATSGTSPSSATEPTEAAESTYGTEATEVTSSTASTAGTNPTSLLENYVVINGITGGVGITPSIAALDAGMLLGLANKESIVVGEDLLKFHQKFPNQIYPVDSEHSAIHQCLFAGKKSEISKLILTASGGPFFGKSRSELKDVTVEQALNHPNWSMGRVVTINSSTLVNKGLELIEASRLFDVPPEKIQVAVQRQSIVHSGVEFIDGSCIWQASNPDMHLPIALALNAGENSTKQNRLPGATAAMDWSRPFSLDFSPVDDLTFPAINLAIRAMKTPGATAVYNYANEVFVDAFCDKKIGYLDIVDNLQKVIELYERELPVKIEGDLLGAFDTVKHWAIRAANSLIS